MSKKETEYRIRRKDGSVQTVTAREFIDQCLVPEVDANAELLAAAKAAETALSGLSIEWSVLTDDQHGRFPGAGALKKLRAAIAKATGEAREAGEE